MAAGGDVTTVAGDVVVAVDVAASGNVAAFETGKEISLAATF